MALRASVIADPDPQGTSSIRRCFACRVVSQRRPAINVTLTSSQVVSRAKVDTGDVPNPFCVQPVPSELRVPLCSDCRHKDRGWHVIADVKRHGIENSKKALRLWKLRCAAQTSKPIHFTCVLCPVSSVKTEFVSLTQKERGQRARGPVRDWALLNLVPAGKEVKDAFSAELRRYSGCSEDTALLILKKPSEVRFCSRHLAHCRFARLAARKVQLGSTDAAGVCVFQHVVGCKDRGSLWTVPVIDNTGLESLERLTQLEEAVYTHSEENYHALEVMGKRVCRCCLYVINEGQSGTAPAQSINTLASIVDKYLVYCIERSLGDVMDEYEDVLDNRASILIASVVTGLRSKCVVSHASGLEVRMLPFREVCACREQLRALDDSDAKPSKAIDARTVEKRLREVLSGKGIILKRVSYKFRYYMKARLIGDLLLTLSVNHASTVAGFRRPSIMEGRSFLDTVGKHFLDSSESYWNGSWSLSKEVSKIPQAFWTDVVLLMASDTRLSTWTLAAKASGIPLLDMFPISNCETQLPKPSIEEALNYKGGGSHSRADLLISVRVLKVVEQMVMSHSKSIPGPLTVSLSVSGICEVSPSFVSVLNSMALFLSYNATEKYRQRLIAQREVSGPWKSSEINPVSVPVLQFDNWDIKPLHAVKVDGKSMPKINGSLLQG